MYISSNRKFNTVGEPREGHSRQENSITKAVTGQGLFRILQGTSLAGWPLSTHTHGNTVGEKALVMSRGWKLDEFITHIKEFFLIFEDK